MSKPVNSSQAIWLHIGAGSFHRAHQAWYLHRLIATGDSRWSIALANIRDDATPLLNTLAEQQGQYVLETVTPQGVRQYETITSISKVIPWDNELAALTAQGPSQKPASSPSPSPKAAIIWIISSTWIALTPIFRPICWAPAAPFTAPWPNCWHAESSLMVTLSRY